MTKILMIGAALSSVLVLTACNKSADSETNQAATNSTTTDTTQSTSAAPVTQPTTTTATAAPDAAHTAENSLDWNGKYEGTLPCADCPGIKTVLTLNLDKTYTLEETYLERDVKPSISKGTFNFDNKNTSIIVLDGAAQQRQYFIGEGFADARAIDGSAIDGPLKAHYKLKKVG